jgi:hypothetical protein
MSPKPFAVRIFLQDGTIDGVKIVAKSKWTGRGIVIPRPLMAEELERPELNVPGVYILIGPEEEGTQKLLIGSALVLSDHLRKEDAESNFWSWAIVSNAKKKELELYTIQYLEARLLQAAQESSNVHLVNPNLPEIPLLNDDERDEAEAFFEHLIAICPILGLRVFEKPKVDEAIKPRG